MDHVETSFYRNEIIFSSYAVSCTRENSLVFVCIILAVWTWSMLQFPLNFSGLYHICLLFHNGILAMTLYLCIILAKKLQFNFSHCCNVLSYFCFLLASFSGEHQTWGFLWRPGWLSHLQVQDRYLEHCGMSFTSRRPLLCCPTYSYDVFFCLSSNAGLLYH